MPATKKRKTNKSKKTTSKKRAPAKKMSTKKMEKTGRMSEEMKNAMMMLFAGGMIVLAYVMYVTYA